MNKKNILLLFSAVAAVFAFFGQRQNGEQRDVDVAPVEASAPSAPKSAGVGQDSALTAAIESRARDVPVEGEGLVVKLLRDDNNGSRHQKFLLRVPSGQVLLVAHNIDLAPRIDTLHEGDKVSFSGEYIWNEKGGVVHWTHHDPSGNHPGGWLKHEERIYQ